VESEAIRKLLTKRTLERDRIEYTVGDVLDVKAGLVLAILVFLAGQAIDLFKDAHESVEISLLAISLVAIIIGAIFALVQWFPRRYSVVSHPAKYRPWLEDLFRRFAAQNVSEADTLEHLEKVELDQASSRIDINIRHNRKKMLMMKGCFACVFISLFANLATVAVRHLFPLCH